MEGLRKSPRLNRVPTEEVIVEEEHTSLIGLTASRMYAKSSSDPLNYSTPNKRENKSGKDSVVPGTPDVKKEVPDGVEIEYLIRQRTVGASVQYYVKWVGYDDNYNSWVDKITFKKVKDDMLEEKVQGEGKEVKEEGVKEEDKKEEDKDKGEDKKEKEDEKAERGSKESQDTDKKKEEKHDTTKIEYKRINSDAQVYDVVIEVDSPTKGYSNRRRFMRTRKQTTITTPTTKITTTTENNFSEIIDLSQEEGEERSPLKPIPFSLSSCPPSSSSPTTHDSDFAETPKKEKKMRTGKTPSKSDKKKKDDEEKEEESEEEMDSDKENKRSATDSGKKRKKAQDAELKTPKKKKRSTEAEEDTTNNTKTPKKTSTKKRKAAKSDDEEIKTPKRKTPIKDTPSKNKTDKTPNKSETQITPKTKKPKKTTETPKDKTPKKDIYLEITPAKTKKDTKEMKTPKKKTPSKKGKEKAKQTEGSEGESEEENGENNNNNNNNNANNVNNVNNNNNNGLRGRWRNHSWEEVARFARITPNTNTNSVAAVMGSAPKNKKPEKGTKRVKRHTLMKDGKLRVAAKFPSLQQLCMELLVQHIDNVESFGLIAPHLQQWMCDAMTKKGKMNNDTVKLFLDPGLSHLALSNCETLDGSSLNLIALTCNNLVTLSLNGCGKLSNDTLDLITKKCPLLEELTLQGSYRISDDSLTRFVEAHPFLKKLELWWLDRLTSRFTQKLSVACPGLRNLHFIMCPQIDNEFVEPISRMKSLHSLQLEKADGLSDSGVQKMLEGSKDSLTRLWINDCDRLTEDCSSFIAECPNLTDISLNNLERMTDGGVERILMNCKKITSLSLNYCRTLGDLTVENVATLCPEIKLLHIGGLPRLTLVTLDCLVGSKMLNIVDLDISWCRWVEDGFLEKLIAKQKHMQRVTMWGTSRVTDVGVGTCLQVHGLDVVGKTSVVISKD